MPHDHDLPLLSWRPSHEETPEHFKREPGDPRDYTREFEDWRAANPAVFEWIEQRALTQRDACAKRIEVNDLWADARSQFAVRANNSLRAACARALLSRNPSLRGLIRTRATTRTK